MSTRATEAESVLKEHMGYLPVSEMERRGVSRTEISRFVREAKLEKAAKGLYVSPNAESDPLFELQYRYPKAIFSHETALFLLGEGERAITMFGRPRWSGPGRRFRYDFPALSSMIRGVLSPGTGTPDDR